MYIDPHGDVTDFLAAKAVEAAIRADERQLAAMIIDMVQGRS